MAVMMRRWDEEAYTGMQVLGLGASGKSQSLLTVDHSTPIVAKVVFV